MALHGRHLPSNDETKDPRTHGPPITRRNRRSLHAAARGTLGDTPPRPTSPRRSEPQPKLQPEPEPEPELSKEQQAEAAAAVRQASEREANKREVREQERIAAAEREEQEKLEKLKAEKTQKRERQARRAAKMKKCQEEEPEQEPELPKEHRRQRVDGDDERGRNRGGTTVDQDTATADQSARARRLRAERGRMSCGCSWHGGHSPHCRGVSFIETPRDVAPSVGYGYSKKPTGFLPLPPVQRRPEPPRNPRPWQTERKSTKPGRKRREAAAPPPWEHAQTEMKMTKVKRTVAADPRAAEKSDVEAELRAVFAANDPRMLVSVPILMANWEGKERRMLDRIREKYDTEAASAEASERISKRCFFRPL